MNIDDTIALERTPAALDALLRDLPKAWTTRNEGEGTWSAFDILDDLLDEFARARAATCAS